MTTDDRWDGTSAEAWADTDRNDRGDGGPAEGWADAGWDGRRGDPGRDGGWSDRWAERAADASVFERYSQPTSYAQPASHAAPPVEPAAKATDPGAARSRASRRAHLQVSRVNPWSVTKFGFIVALVCFIVLFVAVLVLYGLLAALGVFAAVNSVVSSVTATGADLFSLARILGYTAFAGGINVLLITLLTTVAAYVYNLAADLVGGIELTLSEPRSLDEE